jgi:hypothetical protein
MPLNYENFRVFLMPISSEEAASKFHLLAKFPIQLALSVSSALQTLSSAYSPQNPSVFRDDTPLSAIDFDFWANTCRDAQALFRVAQSQIAYTMHKEFGADLPISTDIKEAGKRFQSLAARVT